MAKNDIVIGIGGDAKDFENASKDVKKEISGLGKTVNALGGAFTALSGPVGIATKALKMGFTAATTAAKTASAGFGAMGAAGSLALKNIVEVGSEFEQSMANVASVTGGGAEAMDTLGDAAREMGKTSIFSASQAAEAMYYLGSAGYDTTQTIDSLGGVMTLAGATMSDLSFTSQTMVSSLSQFGMQAGDATKVSNIFAAAIKNSQLNMGRLASGMQYIGPIAHSLGWTMEETAGALGTLNNMGFLGEMAGTALRGAMTRLLNPTDAARAAFERIGVAYEQLNPATNSLADIIDVLSSAGLSAGDAMTIFGQRAGPAMVAMVSQGSGALRNLTSAVTGTNDATEMLALQTDTVQGKWKLFKSAVQEIWLVLWDHLKPALKAIIDNITGITNRIGDWLKTSGGLVAWGTVITTALSMVASVVLGLIGFFPILAAVMFALAPVALAVFAALGFVAIGAIELAKQAGLLAESWNASKESIITSVTTMWETLKTSFTNIYNKVAAWWEEYVPLIIEAWKNLNDKWTIYTRKIVDTFNDAIWFIEDTIAGFLSSDDGTLNALGEALRLFAEGDWEGGWKKIKETVSLAWDFITDLITKWWETLPVLMNDLADKARPILLELAAGIGGAMAAGFKAAFIAGVESMPGDWWNIGVFILKLIWKGFTTMFKEHWGIFFGPLGWGAQWAFEKFFGDTPSTGSSGGGSSSGSSTKINLPGENGSAFYGNNSTAGSQTIIFNMPPGSSRETARRTLRIINREQQLYGGFAI